jgi:hypothetical protein
MMALKLTNDRKTRLHKTQKNTFGLLPGKPREGGTCPGATKGEGGCQYVAPGKKNATCYVVGLMKAYTNVRNSLQHNTDLVKKATEAELVELFSDMFAEFKRIEVKRGNGDNLYFRHHWSGDMLNKKYCRALKTAMLRFPEINFWTYTRSWFALSILSDVPNLMLYISAEKDNLKHALKFYMDYEDNPNVAFAYMGEEKPDIKGMRMIPCPVDNQKMALEEACQKCKLCLKGKTIFFKTK